MAANEVSESQEESDDATSRTIEDHGSVAEEHGDDEVEVGGEAEGEVRENDAGHGGEEVFNGGGAGDVAPDEADR